jgi:predicted DNA-binding protein
MELRLTPELETKLAEFSATTGRAPDDLIQDAIVGYLEELAELRGTLDRR